MSEKVTESANHSQAIYSSERINSLREGTLDALSGYYFLNKPDQGLHGFKNNVFLPMRADESSNGARTEAAFRGAIESRTTFDSRFAALAISCAYCVDVSRHLAQGEPELAWECMAAARYWCGVTVASRGLEEARQSTIVETRKITGINAAKVGVERRLTATKEEAFRLARELKPHSGWRSRRQAMLLIKMQVIEFSGRDGRKKLSEMSAGETIYRWLAKMPDAALLFPRKPAEE